MKIKKQHRKKKYLHKLNRKRMRNHSRSTGPVACKIIKDAWDNKKSSIGNLREMGLADDPNKVIKIPKRKDQLLQKVKQTLDSEEEVDVPKVPRKVHVVKTLEQEAKAPRERRFMLPKSQVEFVTHMLDKYGHDYKAMAKDRKNYYQETWKQLRAKVKTFMGIPKQYSQYLKQRGLLEKDDYEDEIKMQAKAMIMDDSD